MKRFALLLMLVLSLSAFAQTPGTSQYPTSLDSNTTLLTAVNGCSTTLSSAVDNSQTSFTVVSTSCFPSTGIFTLESEVLIYTGKTSNTFTGLTRGAFSTTAVSHASGLSTRLAILAQYHNVTRDALIAVQTKLGTGSATATSNTVFRGIGTGQTDFGQITNAYVASGAAIDVTKLSFSTYFDVTRISAPGNPASGNLRLFANNSTGKLACLDNSGADCMPSGGGGGGSGTVNSGTQYRIAFYASTGTAVDGLANLTTDASGVLSHATTVRTTGNPLFYHRIITPADTGLTAATESIGVQIGGDTSAATVTRQFTGGGSWTLQREYRFVPPTYAATSSTTIPDVATVDASPPNAGTNVTLTRSNTYRANVTNTAHHGFWAAMPAGANGDAFFNTVAGTKVFRVAQNGGETNVVVRANGDVSSSATDGFLYVSQFSGFTAPSGTPTTYAGAPILVGKDATFGWHGLWGYVNGAWIDFSGIFTRYTSSTGTGAQTINFAVWGAHITRTFTLGAGNATLSFTAPKVSGTLISLIIIQDSTGGRTITWPASVKWAGGSAAPPDTGANAKTVYTFIFDGTNYYNVGYAAGVS